MSRPPFAPVTEAELAVLREQLGRPARGVLGIAARCACGNPTVVATAPRLPDGTPFPTFYYLTHPGATAAMSVLEADHTMRELADQLDVDDEIAAKFHVPTIEREIAKAGSSSSRSRDQWQPQQHGNRPAQ